MATKFYSDLFGAAIVGDPDPQVIEFAADTGVLAMGSIIALDGSGRGVLVAARTQAAPFGILLHDVTLVTTAPLATGSVGRRGSYKAERLIVSAGVDGAVLEKALRDAGILLEGRLTVPALAEAAA